MWEWLIGIEHEFLDGNILKVTVNQLILAMLGEAVFLLLLWLIYSVIRIRKLKKSKGSKVVVKEVPQEPKEEVEIPTYLTFLSQAMLATELRMEESNGDNDSTDDSFNLGGDYSDPLELRMAFIRSEISAIEASGEDGSAYWKSQEQSLKEILESIPSIAKEPETAEEKPETPTADDTADVADSAEVEAVRTELNVLKQQAQSLEQYKTLFYGLAGKLKDATEAARPITEQLESVKEQLEDNSVIDVLSSSYENEFSLLQNLLDNIGDGELDEITLEKLNKMLEMRTKRPKEKVVYVDKAEHKVRKEVDKLKSVSDQQKSIISELQGMLEMSEDEGMKGEFLTRINALESALSESKMCIDVLENENQSRQEQLEDLLITLDDLTARAEGAEEAAEADVDDVDIDPDDLLAEVQQQTQTAAATDNDMVELEREKLDLKRKLAAIEEEQQELTKELEEKKNKVDELESVISRFSRESGDVMNAVVTLEDENNRLIDEVDKIKHEKEELEGRLNEEQPEDEAAEENVSDDDIEALLASASDILDGADDSAAEDGSSEENAGMGEQEFEQVSQQIDNDINIELAELEEQNQGLNEELLKSKGELDAKQEELEKALEEFSQKEQEQSSLSKLLDEKDESLKQKQQELDLAQKELQQLKEEVQDKDVQYERLKKEFSEMEQSLAGLV